MILALADVELEDALEQLLKAYASVQESERESSLQKVLLQSSFSRYCLHITIAFLFC